MLAKPGVAVGQPACLRVCYAHFRLAGCAVQQEERSSQMSWFDRLIKRKQPQAYHDPVDGQTYVAPGGWTEYNPLATHWPAVRWPVRLDHVRLLSPQDLVATNVTVEALARFLKDVETRVMAQLRSSTTAFEVQIHVNLFPDQAPQLRMAARGDAPHEQLQQVHDALGAVEPLRTREHPISAQLHFTISASSG
jgi:hypothetical protein